MPFLFMVNIQELQIGHQFPQSSLSAAMPLILPYMMARLLLLNRIQLPQSCYIKLDLSSNDQKKLQEGIT